MTCLDSGRMCRLESGGSPGRNGPRACRRCRSERERRLRGDRGLLGRSGGHSQIDWDGRRDGGFGGRKELREGFAEGWHDNILPGSRRPGVPRVEEVIPPACPEVVPREIVRGVLKQAVTVAGAYLQEVNAVVTRHQVCSVVVASNGVGVRVEAYRVCGEERIV